MVTKSVKYTQGLIQSLETSLRSAFNVPSLLLNRKPRPASLGTVFQIFPVGTYKTINLDDGSEQTVVEILTAEGKPTIFHFGFVADFEIGPTHEYILKHASLSLFNDIFGELIPLFRAEWDEVDALSKTSNHAQPHWHFVQQPKHIEGIVRNFTEAQSSTKEFSPETGSDLFFEQIDCGKLHFAMTSLWDKDNITPHKQLFDSNDFPKWFESLANYIANQISFLLSKMPTPAAAFKPETDS